MVRRVTKRTLTAGILGLFLLLFAGQSPAADNNWRNLTPKEKERVRQNVDRWEKLPPQDKERLREEWDRWKKFPQDRRDRIKQRYDEQRRDRDRHND